MVGVAIGIRLALDVPEIFAHVIFVIWVTGAAFVMAQRALDWARRHRSALQAPEGALKGGKAD
eukprot:CAMPEP_0171156680 /NCGR_PEP_ID=MMETSP0790-20130122/1569_1 /TAXON_ID=2925 /ORGANISM="Alexandrium catenella, Strain OF101" /LENGTH=62 /DNA_ID=CAMNT_0011620995 /DNA_START=64 /DNA_END=252 /DNA_ORIENTATION=+